VNPAPKLDLAICWIHALSMNTPTDSPNQYGRATSSGSTSSATLAVPPTQDTGDTGEDPYSPGHQPFALLVGALIGLLSITVPLVAVVAARPSPSVPTSFYGSQPPAGIPSARAGEPGGGDSRWLPQ
jgi:hypothetical protein